MTNFDTDRPGTYTDVLPGEKEIHVWALELCLRSSPYLKLSSATSNVFSRWASKIVDKELVLMLTRKIDSRELAELFLTSLKQEAVSQELIDYTQKKNLWTYLAKANLISSEFTDRSHAFDHFEYTNILEKSSLAHANRLATKAGLLLENSVVPKESTANMIADKVGGWVSLSRKHHTYEQRRSQNVLVSAVARFPGLTPESLEKLLGALNRNADHYDTHKRSGAEPEFENYTTIYSHPNFDFASFKDHLAVSQLSSAFIASLAYFPDLMKDRKLREKVISTGKVPAMISLLNHATNSQEIQEVWQELAKSNNLLRLLNHVETWPPEKKGLISRDLVIPLLTSEDREVRLKAVSLATELPKEELPAPPRKMR